MEKSATAIATTSDDKWMMYAVALAGPRQDYYLKHFRRIDSGTRWGLSWNWAAMLFTFGWLRYRRMYAYAWAYFLISTPMLILIGSLLVADGCTVEVAGAWITAERFLVVLSLGYLIPALYANRLYFSAVTRRIAAAGARESDGDARGRRLQKPTSTAGYLDPVVMTIVVVLGSAIVLPLLPLYHHSGPRMMVSKLLVEGTEFQRVIAEFFVANKRLPMTIEEIDEVPRLARMARALSIEPSGAIRLVAGFTPLDGRSIFLIPGISGDRIKWSCRSDDIPNVCLPAFCRK